MESTPDSHHIKGNDMSHDWPDEAIFYHIYPLGFSGAPVENNPDTEIAQRLPALEDHIGSILSLGCNAVYFGPVFESTSHGYDTIDYRRIDRRLGSNDEFRTLVDRMHEAGIRVVLDGVFNHVGRGFPGFQDLLINRDSSSFTRWFKDVDFNSDNSSRDGLSYQGWEGHEELVSLNLENPDVRNHIFDAVTWMIRDLDIDGLRLDVAYMLDPEFLHDLAAHCRSLKSDFWLMGEIIHGDCRSLTGGDMLDSATNYECYKGIHSSHNEGNFFEIAWSLNRQSGPEGIYRDIRLYNFLDNHDVDRIATILNDPDHLSTAYALLFTMPGIPSVYYGSEWNARGARTEHDDRELRPKWADIDTSDKNIFRQISLLAQARGKFPALSLGDYRQIHVGDRQLIFERSTEGQSIVVALNASADNFSWIPDEEENLVNIFDSSDFTSGKETIDIPRKGWKIYRRITDR